MEHTSSRLDISRRVQRAYARIRNSFYQYGMSSTKRLFLPDFLGIGSEKSGTTWLYEVLDKHPEVFVSHKKELEYFSVHIKTKSIKFYSDIFKDGAEKVKGEITPGYSFIPVARIRFIQSIMPHVRLILLMRNPVEQQWSIAVHLLARIPGIEVADVPDYKFLEFFKKSAFYRLGGYTGILNRWLSVFSAEQFYVGFYDDIKKQPKKLLCEVFHHIGVSCEIDWEALPYNEVIVPPAGPQYEGRDMDRGVIDPQHRNSVSFLPDRYRLFLQELYCDEIKALHNRFGERVAGWVRS